MITWVWKKLQISDMSILNVTTGFGYWSFHCFWANIWYCLKCQLDKYDLSCVRGHAKYVCKCTRGHVKLIPRTKRGHTLKTMKSWADQPEQPHSFTCNGNQGNLGEAEGGQSRVKRLSERKQLLPAQAHHQAQAPHPISFETRCWMVSLMHSFVFAGCFVTCSASLSSLENLEAEKKQTHWSKDVPCYSTPLCGGRQADDQCDNCWKKRSEVTKRNWRHHGIAMRGSHPDPSICPSP